MLLYLPNGWEEFRTSVTQLKLGFFQIYIYRDLREDAVLSILGIATTTA